jgi:hypothetical protein
MIRRFSFPLILLLLASCTTSAPLIDHTHPASADAAESVSKPMPRVLAIDDATQRTRELLAERAAEEKAAQDQPVAPRLENEHEHH